MIILIFLKDLGFLVDISKKIKRKVKNIVLTIFILPDPICVDNLKSNFF